MLKILQARLQQHVKYEISDIQAGFRKGRGTRDQIANICKIMEKASRGDGIPVELFQILKDDAVKVNMPENLENSAVATGLEKVSFHSNSKERQCKRMLKLPQNCTHSSHTLVK